MEGLGEKQVIECVLYKKEIRSFLGEIIPETKREVYRNFSTRRPH